MTEEIREIQEREINTNRLRVHCLSQELWATPNSPTELM
jgi:hypothetical protein